MWCLLVDVGLRILIPQRLFVHRQERPMNHVLNSTTPAALLSPPQGDWSTFYVRQAVMEDEIAQAMALRRAVFCEEQGIFSGSDQDEVDAHARLLIAAANAVNSGINTVLGTVRIHEASPGIWWGSRLAVQRTARRHGNLGANLIRLAVSTAHALGCETFLAHVQVQNVPMFEKLHWKSLDTSLAHGRAHHLMQADLSCYPPCHDPLMGFFVAPRGHA
jgi:putative N-acetyltransferase (TIGR04045 family)